MRSVRFFGGWLQLLRWRTEGISLFSERVKAPRFEFDCELVPGGLRSDRGGEYFSFLGFFLEQLTGQFGRVEVEDA